MKGDIGEVVSPRLKAPQSEVCHEAHGNQGPVDLRGLSNKGLPERAGKNLRQIRPVPDEKILDNESPVIPDKEVTEAVYVEKRCEAGYNQNVDQFLLHVFGLLFVLKEAEGKGRGPVRSEEHTSELH